MSHLRLPTYEDVLDAAQRLNGHAVHTPLLRCTELDELTGCKVFVKPECLQRTGTFKFRGAFNTLASMSDSERRRGVLAVSSGNHAQGVAAAARLFGVAATIIMPSDAPRTKIERTRRLGAEVMLYDRLNEDREELARQHQLANNSSFVHPYNDPRVIAGQGTAGLEAAQDLEAIGERPDHVLVCTGGGGLTAGIALSMAQHFPAALVHTCEPEGFDDYRRSLESGRRETNEKAGGSICDAIVTPMPGEISFAVLQRIAAGKPSAGYQVSDEEALRAVAFAFRELKLVVEPGGAVALASLFRNREQLAGTTVLLTLSGGNIDEDVMQRALMLPEQS